MIILKRAVNQKCKVNAFRMPAEVTKVLCNPGGLEAALKAPVAIQGICNTQRRRSPRTLCLCADNYVCAQYYAEQLDCCCQSVVDTSDHHLNYSTHDAAGLRKRTIGRSLSVSKAQPCSSSAAGNAESSLQPTPTSASADASCRGEAGIVSLFVPMYHV
jgi:hypothetical protein